MKMIHAHTFHCIEDFKQNHAHNMDTVARGKSKYYVRLHNWILVTINKLFKQMPDGPMGGPAPWTWLLVWKIRRKFNVPEIRWCACSFVEKENEMKLTRISNDAANEQQIKHKSLAGLNKRPDLLQLRSFSMAQLQSKFRAAMLHAAFATCVRLQTADCPPSGR